MCQLAQGRRRLTRQRRGGSRWDREGSWGGGGEEGERGREKICASASSAGCARGKESAQHTRGVAWGREIAASCQTSGQTGKREEQRSPPAQGTTAVLSLIRAKWLIHTFIFFFFSQLKSFKQPNPSPSPPRGGSSMALLWGQPRGYLSWEKGWGGDRCPCSHLTFRG